MSIDVAETGNVLDANGRKVVVLCPTKKGMVLQLVKFRQVTGGRFPRWCYAKEEQALPDATAAAKFQQFLRKGGSYSGADACDALLPSKSVLARVVNSRSHQTFYSVRL